MSVVLGRRQIGVAEKLLHSPQIGASVEKMSRKRVAKGMRVRGRRRPSIEDSPRIARCQLLSARVAEDRVSARIDS